MLVVAAAVFAVWTVLLGAAYLARGVLGWRRTSSVALVAACYGVLAAAALAVIGASGRGVLGVAGMLVPLAVAVACVALSGGR